MKESMNAKMDQVLHKFEKQQEENRKIHATIQKLSSEVEKLKTEMSEIKNKPEISPISNQEFTPYRQAILQNKPSPSERGIRRNNLIVTGITVENGDAKSSLQEYISQRFHTRSDGILAVQPINTRGQNDGNVVNSTRGPETPAPPVRYLVTFKSPWEAQLIYSQRLQNLRNENVYISEDLTVSESRLFYKARQLKKNNLIHSTWTREGKVYVRKRVDQDPIEICEEHEIFTNFPDNGKKSVLTPTSPEFRPSNSSSPPISPAPSPPPTSLPSSSNEIKDSSRSSDHLPQKSKSSEPLDQEKDLADECMTLLQGAITRATEKKRRRQKEETKNAQ